MRCPCGNELKIHQKKYCSRSCSVRYTNSTRKRPHQNRLKPHFCRVCGSEIARKNYKDRRRLCDECTKSHLSSTASKIGNKSLGDIKGRNFHRKIRDNARVVFKRSKQQPVCKVCGYSLHVDVCHVIPVSNFPEDVLVSKVNDIHNLVALCKNHHWEFDNGYLDIKEWLARGDSNP